MLASSGFTVLTHCEVRRTKKSLERWADHRLSSFSYSVHVLLFWIFSDGAPTPVRTGNPQFRRLMLYPIELWVHCQILRVPRITFRD